MAFAMAGVAKAFFRSAKQVDDRDPSHVRDRDAEPADVFHKHALLELQRSAAPPALFCGTRLGLAVRLNGGPPS